MQRYYPFKGEPYSFALPQAVGSKQESRRGSVKCGFLQKKKKRKDAFLVRFTVWLNNPFSPVLIPGKGIEAEDKTVYPL